MGSALEKYAISKIKKITHTAVFGNQMFEEELNAHLEKGLLSPDSNPLEF